MDFDLDGLASRDSLTREEYEALRPASIRPRVVIPTLPREDDGGDEDEWNEEWRGWKESSTKGRDATYAAKQRLVDAHSKEFRALVAEERAKRGLSAKTPPVAGPNIETKARNCLARRGLSLADAIRATDRELLLIPNFGKVSLAWVRNQTNEPSASRPSRLRRLFRLARS